MGNFNLSYEILTSNDDVKQTTAGGVIAPTATTLSCSPGLVDDQIYLRFKLDGLQNGATINEAKVTFKASSAWTDDYSPLIKLEDTDNAAAYDVATPENIFSRTYLAGTTWNTTSWSSGATVITVDFSSQLQTIVDKVGWADGNYINIQFNIASAGSKDDDIDFYSFDHSTEPGPQLNISATQSDILSEWDGYEEFTVESTLVDEAIGYCPIYLSNASADFWTALDDHSDTTGETIRVASADGATQYAAYVVSIDTVLEEGLVVFESDSMSTSTDTTYRLYAGHPTATTPDVTDTYGRNAVFAGSAAVYSLTDVDALTDLTGNGYNLTASNAPTAGATGPHEGLKAYTFASSSSQSLDNSALPDWSWPLTVEGFCYQTSVANQTAFGIEDTVGDQYAQLRVAPYDAWNVFQGYCRGIKYSSSSTASISGTNQTTWYYAATSRDAETGTTTIYRNGTTATNTTTVLSAAFDSVRIGCSQNITKTEFFDGKVSWVAVTQATRSINALNTQQAAWDDPTFITFGGWTANGGVTGDIAQTFFGLSQAATGFVGIADQFNFRATSGYVTDGVKEIYVLGETSSQTRKGRTFQWDVCGDCSRDRSTGVGSRFAGVNKRSNDGTQNTWTLTLPETGYYEIRAALGDATNTASPTYAYFYDDATLIDDIVGVTASPTTADYYIDATGVTLANAAWDAGNTAITHNFASTTFKLVIGSPGVETGETRVAHLQITKVDAPGGGDIVILRRRRM